MRMLWGLILLSLSVSAPAHADGISGTYVGNGTNSAFFVQLVATAEGQLTGRYEQTVLDQSGKIEQMIASITGASDGHTIVVTIKPVEPFAGTITASGTLDGLLLHLSGGGNGGTINLNLAKSEEVTYRTQVAELTNQARGINEGKARADQLTRMRDLTERMVKAAKAADAQLEKFPPVEQRYREITKLMNAGLARQRSIYGSGQASVVRGQVGVAINQAGVEAEQLHQSMTAANHEIGGKIQSIVKEENELSHQCQTDSFKRTSELNEACGKLFDAAMMFKRSVVMLGQAFESADKIWVEESRKQKDIIQESDTVSR